MSQSHSEGLEFEGEELAADSDSSGRKHLSGRQTADRESIRLPPTTRLGLRGGS